MNFHTKKFKIWHTQNTRVVVGKYVGKRFSRLKKKITKLNESKIKKVVHSQKSILGKDAQFVCDLFQKKFKMCLKCLS